MVDVSREAPGSVQAQPRQACAPCCWRSSARSNSRARGGTSGLPRSSRRLREGRTGCYSPDGKAGGSSPMKPELTAEALVRLVHRYYPTGIESYDPRYETSMEARRLHALLEAHVGGTPAWKDFIQRLF